MFIQTEVTPNPASLKFLPNRQVLGEDFGNSGMFFQKADMKEYQRSPLAKKLFTIEGVSGVFLGKDFITVSKTKGMVWQILKPDIFATIMDFYAEGKAAVLPAKDDAVTDTTILDDDDEVVAMVKELLETRIRPAVQEDGGDIFFKGFDEDTGLVSVQLAGSCSGCPSSSVTLKNGVENMLMHYIPEVTGVVQVDEEGDEESGVSDVEPMTDFDKKLAAAGIPSA